MSGLTFAEPLWLGLGLALALLFGVSAWVGERRARAHALDYSDLTFLEAVAGRRAGWTALLAASWMLAIAGAGAALARPSAILTVAVRDGAVVLCIDTSGSMASTDVTPTRSEAARTAAASFVAGLPQGTRIAVVAFSSNALPLGPLVTEPAAVRDQLAHIPAPNGATAIGSAIDAAFRLLPPRGRRAIVVVTDGVNNTGLDPLAVAREAGKRGVAIFTVGIGTNGSGAMVPGTNEAAGLDEEALREIARDGGGSYARVADAAALRSRLTALSQNVVEEQRRVDLAFAVLLGAAGIAIGAAFAGSLAGRVP